MSTIALLTISDRPDYLARTLQSAAANLPGFDQYVLVEDNDHQLGFAGAIARGWNQVDTDYVLHLEGDFTFNEPVDVDAILSLLERHPYLAQVSLKRQAWNAAEREAGGIVETRPEQFLEACDGEATWTEHRSYFTTTPSIYSAALCRRGWPQCPQSEGVFTHQLLEDPGLRFAIWGAKFDAPRVEHIGLERAGHGY